jgi:FMN reductase
VALDAAAGRGAYTEMFAGRRLMLPIFDTESDSRDAEAEEFLAAVRRAVAVIISSPGYHGALSGMIKNALDYLEDLRDDRRPYLDGMPVGCIAVAYGWQATSSTLQSIRTTVHALRGWPSPMGATINASLPIFNGHGECTDESAQFQLRLVGEQVTDFATMRTGRSILSLAGLE